MTIDEEISNLKSTLAITIDKEIISCINSRIESLETDKKIISNHKGIIDNVITLIENSDIENKVMVSNKLINFISILKELNNDKGLQLISNLQNTFKDIPDKDTEEIMRHVYSSFFFKNIKKRIEEV